MLPSALPTGHPAALGGCSLPDPLCNRGRLQVGFIFLLETFATCANKLRWVVQFETEIK